MIGLLLFYVISRRTSRGQMVGSEGPRFSEREAESLLHQSGYQILDKQPKGSVVTNVDSKSHFGYLESDYLVRKNKKDFVATVHVTEGDPDPNEPTLRRKLLAYDRVFSPDALLVLDLNQGRIYEVSFNFPRERNIDFFFRFLIGLFIILAVIGIIWLLAQMQLF
jgi:hypothetical protein